MKVSKVILSDEEIAIAERVKRGWGNLPKAERDAADKDIADARDLRRAIVQSNQDAYDMSIGRKYGPPRKGRAKRVIE
tara:strand:+ start:100 stop:333 length:234 start_codon:yes stop_codon:yes gene_type:complete